MPARTRKAKAAQTTEPDDGYVDLVGSNGVEFTAPKSVASGLVRNGAAEYANEDDSTEPEPETPAP